MSALLVGVDCSTSACKAIAWDYRGVAQAEGRCPIALDNPEPDAWEQDAETWWAATTGALKQMTDTLGDDTRDIVGLSVTHQRETFVVTDDRGAPLHPALVWMDTRCRRQVSSAVEAVGADALHEISGKPACTTPSLYKLMFLLDKAPEIAAQRPLFLDVHAFIVWRLTGARVTSLASADPTGLVDMAERDWSPELLGLAGLDRHQVPDLAEPGAPVGHVQANAARATGLRQGLPIYAGAGDGQAAGLGAGIDRPGRAYLNLGTAIVSGVLSDDYVTDRAFRTMMAPSAGAYFLETDLQGGTFTLTWLIEKLLGVAPSETSETLEQLGTKAETLRPGSAGLMLVPYWNGVMNPYWDDVATGLVMGWRGEHGPEHLYRAILEGVAFEQRRHTEGVESATKEPVQELVVMGGGSSSSLWCGIIADVMQKRVTRAGSREATALGAAMLAAVGAGVFENFGEAAKSMSRLGTSFEPGDGAPAYDRLYREVYRGLYESVRGSMQRLSELSR